MKEVTQARHPSSDLVYSYKCKIIEGKLVFSIIGQPFRSLYLHVELSVMIVMYDTIDIINQISVSSNIFTL